MEIYGTTVKTEAINDEETVFVSYIIGQYPTQGTFVIYHDELNEAFTHIERGFDPSETSKMLKKINVLREELGYDDMLAQDYEMDSKAAFLALCYQHRLAALEERVEALLGQSV